MKRTIFRCVPVLVLAGCRYIDPNSLVNEASEDRPLPTTQLDCTEAVGTVSYSPPFEDAIPACEGEVNFSYDLRGLTTANGVRVDSLNLFAVLVETPAKTWCTYAPRIGSDAPPADCANAGGPPPIIFEPELEIQDPIPEPFFSEFLKFDYPEMPYSVVFTDGVWVWVWDGVSPPKFTVTIYAFDEAGNLERYACLNDGEVLYQQVVSIEPDGCAE